MIKKLLILTLTIVAATSLCSCEKAELGNEDDTQQPAGKDDNDDDYTTDGDDDYYEGDIPLGSTVDVATFRNTAIYTQVWVKGYIVGAATGANNKIRYEFGPEFNYDTAILMADSPDADSVDEVISIRLPSGKKRDLLNLKDNPQNKGKRLAVFGFQEFYLKIPGIRDIDGYEFPAE